jgi:hypothetical protein
MNRVSSKQMLSSHAKGGYFLKINKLTSGGASFSLFDLYSYSGSFLLALKKINVFFFLYKTTRFFYFYFFSLFPSLSTIIIYHSYMKHKSSFTHERATVLLCSPRTDNVSVRCSVITDNSSVLCSLKTDKRSVRCSLKTDGHDCS